MIFRKIALLCLMFVSVNSLAAIIRIEVPAHYFQSEDSVVYAATRLTHNQSETNKILFRDGDYYRNEFYVSEPGLYKVAVTIELSSGVKLSDWANGYILSIDDVKMIRPTLNPNCYNSTFSVFWVSDAVIRQSDLYGLSIDTSLLKRVEIPDIDSIADAFYSEGMKWCLELLVHYELLDENYIPLIKYSTGYYRNAITTCQMMFAFHSQYLKTQDPEDMRGFLNNANWLVNNNHSGYYLYDFNFTHDGGTSMKKYWVSAMAQGYAAGALSYAFKVTQDSLYLKEADSVFATLQHNSSDFWCFLIDNKGYYWLEEYPNEDLCHVLNGKMAALWGIFQYYTVTRNKVALRVLEAGIKSVIDNYRIWSVPHANNSYYCLHKNTKEHYHAVHQIQLLAFAARFDIDEFYDVYYCFLNSPVLVEPHNIRFTYLPDTAEVHIESTVNWSINEQVVWLSADIEGNQIHITAEGNVAENNRSATVDVLFENGDKEIISITQAGKPYIYIETDTIWLSYAGEIIDIKVNTNLSDIELLCSNDWLSYSWINDSIVRISSINGNRTGMISLYSTSLKVDVVVICKDFTTQINLNDDSDFTVFPNPVNNILQVISNNNTVAYSYHFKNLFGTTLRSGTSHESTTIDVSDFKPGIYFLVITSSSSDSRIYKIVVY